MAGKKAKQLNWSASRRNEFIEFRVFWHGRINRADLMDTFGSASVIAERLALHPAVRGLRYPGLPGDPSHKALGGQMTNGGFLIGFELADATIAESFLARCPLIEQVTSFGGVHTAAERRARWGDDVADGFIRLSVGVEPVEVLWHAIETALNAQEAISAQC